MILMLYQIVWQMITLVNKPAFWLMTGMVYLQLRRSAKQKNEMFQTGKEPVMGRLLITVIAGLAGGFSASLLFLLLGVSAEQIYLEWLWILAALAMMIRQRFFCFAYAGGILCCMHCAVGWPDIEVSPILMTVAVLHFIEAFLVLSTAGNNALPVYLKTENDQITGGYLMQMTWPLPLIMLFGITAGTKPQAGFFVFPDWWPLIGGETANSLYLLFPVLAALGYSDAVIHSTIKKKTRETAGMLFVYSVLLMGMVFITDKQGCWQFVPALFAPLGHEIVIFLGKRAERKSDAVPYRAPEQGAGVLDLAWGSPAHRAGLRRGDVILSLNRKPVLNRKCFLKQQCSLPDVVTVEYLRRGKRKKCVMHMKKAYHAGIITMPDDSCSLYWSLRKDEGIAKFVYKKCEKTLKNM